MAYLIGGTLAVGGLIWYFSGLDKETITTISTVASNVILFSIITAFIAMGAWRKINVYDAFIDGAKEGFSIAVKIIPYLVAILVAVGVFRAAGAMAMLMSGLERFCLACGADSFAGRLASTFQGATDTTFYIIAVYFGAVGIKNTRYAIPCGLIADFAGIIAALVMAYIFFA